MSGIVGPAEVLARVPLGDLLDVSAPSVAGHAGEVVLAAFNGAPCLLFLGRLHFYQGLSAWETVATVRSLAGTSVEALIVINAAGGLNPAFQVGDIMLISDHINLPGMAGNSPLIPPPDDKVSFFPMRGAYDVELRGRLLEAASGIGTELRQGVYVMVAGPNYETDAELALLRALGADAVGMSTVHEVVMARRLGLRVAGLSVITNRAIPGEAAMPSHDEVLRASDQAVDTLAGILAVIAPGISGKGTG